MSSSTPIKVCITGAGGQIAYSLIFMVANGAIFGKEQPIILSLLDIPPIMPAVQGVILELQDCALPILKDVIATAQPNEAFKDVDIVLMVGAFPRKEGMERKDLLEKNAGIFQQQGAVLDQVAKKSVKVLVVGNPANTNCLVLSQMAPSIPKSNFSCLTRLDHNRGKAQVALKLGVSPDVISKVTIWGNHSSTQYPDLEHSQVKLPSGEVKSAKSVISNDAWVNGDFITTVQQRGAAILNIRKLSSAMSAAKAICDHMRDWHFGTPENDWVSMGVWSDGNPYGIPSGIIYSFPVTCAGGEWKIVSGLSISDFSQEMMQKTAKELVNEKSTAFSFLNID